MFNFATSSRERADAANDTAQPGMAATLDRREMAGQPPSRGLLLAAGGFGALALAVPSFLAPVYTAQTQILTARNQDLIILAVPPVQSMKA